MPTNKKLKEVPKTLREGIELAKNSKLLPKIFSKEVLDHYIHAADRNGYHFICLGL